MRSIFFQQKNLTREGTYVTYAIRLKEIILGFYLHKKKSKRYFFQQKKLTREGTYVMYATRVR
jgi:hypothetical protein